MQTRFDYDYGQVYLRDADYAWSAEFSEYLDALDAAAATRSSVGVVRDFVDVLMPRQDGFGVSLELEVHDAEPARDDAAWDHVVEFRLSTPSGRLVLEASGGGGEVAVDVPPGVHRARWSGRGFDDAGDWDYDRAPRDAYRLQLWNAEAPDAPVELKRWHGYDARYES